METLRVIGSLLLVFGLMGAVLWGLRRMQTRIAQSVPGRRLQMLESISVGTRQKLALVRVDGHEMLIGISPTQITALGQWAVGAAPQPAQSGGQEPAVSSAEDTFPMTARALLEREARREP